MAGSSKATKKKKPKLSAEEQRRRFEETARQLGCDESEEAFDERLRRISEPSPKPKEKSEKAPKE